MERRFYMKKREKSVYRLRAQFLKGFADGESGARERGRTDCYRLGYAEGLASLRKGLSRKALKSDEARCGYDHGFEGVPLHVHSIQYLEGYRRGRLAAKYMRLGAAAQRAAAFLFSLAKCAAF
jgi:hypothetical protein